MKNLIKCYCGHTTTCDCIDMLELVQIPEEPKQETLEEAKKYAELSYYGDEVDAFVRGVKWQKEQNKNKYSEEEVLKFLINCPTNTEKETIEWFEQNKKK